MPCLVCGDPETVESHLVPRALYRAVAGKEQNSFQASRNKFGYKLQGKGVFDRSILCSKHEKMLGPADDYGVRFVRSFNQRCVPSAEPEMATIENRRPDLLVRFVAACVWRRGVSRVGRDVENLDLGPWESKLRTYLFENDMNYRPPLAIVRRLFTSQGAILTDIMLEPRKYDALKKDCWIFYALGCEFLILLNENRRAPFERRMFANRANPALVFDFEPNDIGNHPGLIEVIANAYRDSRTGLPTKRFTESSPDD